MFYMLPFQLCDEGYIRQYGAPRSLDYHPSQTIGTFVTIRIRDPLLLRLLRWTHSQLNRMQAMAQPILSLRPLLWS